MLLTLAVITEHKMELSPKCFLRSVRRFTVGRRAQSLNNRTDMNILWAAGGSVPTRPFSSSKCRSVEIGNVRFMIIFSKPTPLVLCWNRPESRLFSVFQLGTTWIPIVLWAPVHGSPPTAQSVQQLGHSLENLANGVPFPAGIGDLSLLHCVHTGPPSLLYNGYRRLSPRG
jgi:hypothetical protein